MENMEEDKIMKWEKIGKKITPPFTFFPKRIRITPNSYPNLRNIIHPQIIFHYIQRRSNMNKNHKQVIE